jgi:hypothetical protein
MAVQSRSARSDRTGREQRKRTPTGRSRRPDLSKHYGRRLPSIAPGEFTFEVTLLRGKGVASFPLTPYTVSFEWDDTQAAMTGNFQIRRPVPEDPASLPIGRGHRIRVRVRWAGRWYELWTMRCAPPELTLDGDGAVVSVDVSDDLDIVNRGRRHYLRRTRKRHWHGYFGHDVLREEARKDGIRLGQIARCRYRMAKIDVTGSFLDLVTAIYRHEREKTGARFVIRMRDGRLEVVPYRRNALIYVLAEQLRSATVQQQPKVANPATVIVGKARIGKGKAAKKIRHTEYRRDMVRRFGFVRKEKDYGRVGSIGELRAKVRRDLADEYRVEQTADVQHQGIPFIRRGDGAQINLAAGGYRGARSFVYCTGGSHQVEGGAYTSQWSFTTEDPFVKDRDRREKDARARKRRQRQRAHHKAAA